MDTLILWLITSLLLLVGLFGTLIPAVPGVGLVFGGILFYAFLTHFQDVSVTTVIIFGVITVIAWLADYFGSAVGATLAGGKMKALIGTFIGAVIGSVGGPFGIFIGAFIGAFLGALLEGQPSMNAVKIAALSVVGTLGAAVVQFIVAFLMIIAFLIGVFTPLF